MARPDRIGRATVEYGPASQILNPATGFLSGYDFSLNPYSGCTFACTYCYAANFVRDPERKDAWGYWVRVKENAVALLAKRLQRDPAFLDGKRIYMSSVTDPYQPVERELRLTRGLLEGMAQCAPKLVVQTRSPDVARDGDLFAAIVARGGRVQINMTATTDDEAVRRAFEPGCPTNAARLAGLAVLARAGLSTCVTMTPLLWVADPAGFARDIQATGTRRFIIQPFHFHEGEFVAQTRDAAVALMTAKLQCAPEDFLRAYAARYRQARDLLHAALSPGAEFWGEAKGGFAPPF